MHELPVTESLLRIALEHADRVGAHQVTDLYLVLGDLSSIVDDSVAFYWDLVSEGTLAEGARLHFRRVPARLRCLNCGTTYPITDERLRCPGCGGGRVQVIAGDEFYLESIEIELVRAKTTKPEVVGL